MGKLLLILLLGGVLANGLAPRAEPPLLMDSSPAPAPLDEAD